MKFLRRFFLRIANFAALRCDDQHLQEEIAEHLARQTEENLRAGMSPAEARRQAVLKFGAVQNHFEGDGDEFEAWGDDVWVCASTAGVGFAASRVMSGPLSGWARLCLQRGL